MSNNLGNMLKQQRLMRELSLWQLAAMSGVSASHLGRIERGDRFPSARVLRKIATALGFEEVQLLTLAGFLSPQAPAAESETGTGRVDPYVASVLGQQPVGVQRSVVAILSILQSIAKASIPITDPEFREYARRKYPEVDEDVITMIEDILEHPLGPSSEHENHAL